MDENYVLPTPSHHGPLQIKDLLNESWAVQVEPEFYSSLGLPTVHFRQNKTSNDKMLKRERMSEQGLILFLQKVPKLSPIGKILAINRYMAKRSKRNKKRPKMEDRVENAKKKPRKSNGKFAPSQKTSNSSQGAENVNSNAIPDDKVAPVKIESVN